MTSSLAEELDVSQRSNTRQGDEEDDDEVENSELKDLVTDLLTSNGILGKLKAQLRASVYLALEDGDELKKKSPEINRALHAYLQTSDGRLVAHLVREFLAFFDLRYTLSVFDPECLGGYQIPLRDRAQLIEGLGLPELTSAQKPLLQEILRLSKVSVLKSETPTPTERTDDENSMPSSLELDPAPRFAGKQRKSTDSLGATAQNGHQKSLDKSLDYNTTVSSAASSPFSSLNLSGKKEKEQPQSKVVHSGLTKSPPPGNSKSPPTATVKPSTSFTSSTASSNPLGNLPPLNPPGQAKATGGKKSLAPLKKAPKQNISEDQKHEGPSSNAKQETLSKQQLDSAKPLTNPSKIQTTSLPQDEDEIEEEISEELDEFLNSSGGLSAAEDFTKDETASEGGSLKADFKEKL